MQNLTLESACNSAIIFERASKRRTNQTMYPTSKGSKPFSSKSAPQPYCTYKTSTESHTTHNNDKKTTPKTSCASNVMDMGTIRGTVQIPEHLLRGNGMRFQVGQDLEPC